MTSEPRNPDLNELLTNVNELQTQYRANGFLWVSTEYERVSMQKKYQSFAQKSPDFPYALYSRKDVDKCVNLGAAGKKYIQHFRADPDPMADWITGLLFFVGVYTAIVVGVHASWSGFWKPILLIYGLGFLAFFVVAIRIGSRHFLERFGLGLILLCIAPGAAIGFSGTYNWGRDIAIAIFFGVAVYFGRNQKKSFRLLNPPESSSKNSLSNRERVFNLAVWLILTWGTLSAADRMFGSGWWFQEKEPSTPGRFQELQNRTIAMWPEGQSEGVAIALSGGGYRAAILHAGVLRAVEKLGLPVAAMGTISGGSIMGSFYALGGNPLDFVGAVKNGRFNLKRELLNVWEFVHMACPATDPLFSMDFLFFCDPYSRSNVQEKLLDRVLFGETKLSQLPPKESGAPTLIIGAVDLRTGELLGFTRDALFRIPQSSSSGELQVARLPVVPGKTTFESLGNLQEISLSEFVAGSGAFPGAINSIVLTHQFDDEEPTTFNIADGGLADNYGLSLLLAAHEVRPTWKQNLIIVSDGSMPLEVMHDLSSSPEFFRGMDVVYASSGLDDFNGKRVSPKVLRLAPTNFKPHFDSQGNLDNLATLSVDRLKRLFITLPDSFRKERGVNSTSNLRKDIKRSAATFFQVSTLQDQFSMSMWAQFKHWWEEPEKTIFYGESQVDALFALGQYLVYFHCAEISEGLGVEAHRVCKRR